MQNKVVIITGASSGIGKALVYEFAKRGAKIAMGARNLDELQKIETNLKSRGIDALSVQTDVTRELDCENLVEKTVERFGKIDVLVNNAGISMRALFEDLELDVIRRLMDVNFWGTVYWDYPAEYPVLPGSPKKPATEIIPTKLPFVFNI